MGIPALEAIRTVNAEPISIQNPLKCTDSMFQQSMFSIYCSLGPIKKPNSKWMVLFHLDKSINQVMFSILLLKKNFVLALNQT